jgi:D-alanyl-D-alanine carboxypeptidase
VGVESEYTNTLTKMKPVSRRDMLRTSALLGVGLCAGSLPAFRAGARAPLPQLPDSSKKLMHEYMREFSVPGLQLAYVRGTRVLYSGCFGVAHRAKHQPVTTASLFRIASNSKAFTSAAILRLVEAGKLRLEDRVFAPDGILKQFSEIGPHRDWLHAITIYQLLTHTGGGWSNDSNDPMFEDKGRNHDQLIRWTLETHRLQHPPGENYAYSNFGYCVLGRVIERVSGERYPEFVRREVLRPARISDMRIGTHNTAPDEVHYYGQAGENPQSFPIARMDAHGGWIATALDMATFLACLFSPVDNEGGTQILTSESLRTMTTGSAANPGYACGLAVNKAGNAWHSGGLPGTMSLMVHSHSKMCWAVALNTSSPKKDAELRLDKMLWEVAKSVPEWGV